MLVVMQVMSAILIQTSNKKYIRHNILLLIFYNHMMEPNCDILLFIILLILIAVYLYIKFGRQIRDITTTITTATTTRVLPIDKIDSNIYIGSAYVTEKQLYDAGITHIVRVISDHIDLVTPTDIKIIEFNIKDSPETDIISVINQTSPWIRDAINMGGKVFIQCYAGKSRSVSVVIGYLIQMRGMTFEDAFKYVRRVRKCAMPNSGFVHQLKLLEQSSTTLF